MAASAGRSIRARSFPAVAVRDIVIHPRTSDLILATHGRGIWIIDNISPMRALTPDLMSEYAAFLPIPPAVQWMETSGGWMEGDATFVGPNRPTDAAIPYYQRSRHIYGDMKIEVFDAQGKLVDTLATSGHRGINRADVVDAHETTEGPAGGHGDVSSAPPDRGSFPAHTR